MYRKKPQRRRSRVSPVAATVTAEVRELCRQCPDAHPEIWARWLQIAGDQMFKRTFPLKYRTGVLTVGVANSTWLQQLSFLKETLRNRLDEEVGPGVVTEIRFVLDTAVAVRRISTRAIGRSTLKKGPSPPPTPKMLETVATLEDRELADAILRAMTAAAQRS